jgi:hypothetical protein
VLICHLLAHGITGETPPNNAVVGTPLSARATLPLAKYEYKISCPDSAFERALVARLIVTKADSKSRLIYRAGTKSIIRMARAAGVSIMLKTSTDLAVSVRY